MDKIKKIYQHNGTDWGDAIPIGVDAEYVDGATTTPTTNTIAKFDLNNHMNSADMTSSEISNFIAGLDVSGGPTNTTQDDWVVEQGTSGIWTYRKWQSGTIDCLFGSTTLTGYSGALSLYRVGNVVFLSSNGAFRSSSSTIAAGGLLSQTVPNGFRPIEKAYVMSVSAAKNMRLEMATNGNINFYGDAAWDNSSMYISGTWVTNDSIPV